MSSRRRGESKKAAPILDGIDASLLDIVDHVLTKGIVLTGDLVLGVADIDLVYLRLSAVLCAADRVLGSSSRASRHSARPSQPRDTILRSRPIARTIGAPKLRKPR